MKTSLLAILFALLTISPTFAGNGAAAYDTNNMDGVNLDDATFILTSIGGSNPDTDVDLDGDTDFDDVIEWFDWIETWDLNGDYAFAPDDILLVVNEINSGGNNPLMDVNGNGVVNAGDFFAISNEFNRSPWKRNNSGNGVDVNDDGYVSPLDALIIVNALNAGVGPSLVGVPKCRADFLDVNGDKKLTDGDYWAVIYVLNNQ